MIPKPFLKPATITVYDQEIEEILNKEFNHIMSTNRDKIIIEKKNIKAFLNSSDVEMYQLV